MAEVLSIKKLKEIVAGYAQQRKTYFYIGVATWAGSAEESLEQRGYAKDHHKDAEMLKNKKGTNFLLHFYQCYDYNLHSPYENILYR